jgi:hypothetical protein
MLEDGQLPHTACVRDLVLYKKLALCSAFAIKIDVISLILLLFTEEPRYLANFCVTEELRNFSDRFSLPRCLYWKSTTAKYHVDTHSTLSTVFRPNSHNITKPHLPVVDILQPNILSFIQKNQKTLYNPIQQPIQ